MHLDTIHHIAIIGHDYDKTREFYVDKLGFEPLDEHHHGRKVDQRDYLFKCLYLFQPGFWYSSYLIDTSTVLEQYVICSHCGR